MCGEKIMPSQFTDLMREFGAVAGLEDLVPDRNNECVLAIDSFLVTICARNNEELLLYAAVGKLPEDGKDIFMARLLAANYFFAETGGAALGVSPLNGEVQLIYSERLQGLGVSAFTRILENFLARLEHWSAVCKVAHLSPARANAAVPTALNVMRA
jgi:hypothetical protein